ncbi:MAG TPA: ComEC/Rec2 family competence protein, partial [Salinimicrobium sp.]|nr:ComEC/Rec2 family competence protein [Salinimicrobium sp.]
MKLLNSALIRITILFISGILAGFFFSPPLLLSFFILIFTLLIFFFAWLRSKKLIFQDNFFGISCYTLFFAIGIFSTAIHLPQNQPQHYINQTEKSPQLLLISIKEHLKPDLFNEKYIAEVKKLNDKSVHGKMLLLFRKDSLKSPFSVGSKIIISSEAENIPAPLNPYQFNYQEMMENRGIFQQIQTSEGEYQLLNFSKSGIREKAENWRNIIISKLNKEDFQHDELAIIQALLLGQRQDVSTEVYADYAAAGVIHILAVSGLHVGIILLILHWLLAPLEGIKYGRNIKTILLLLLLWGFAMLAGLSPSVIRAVTMFSFVAIGMQLKRRTSVLNSLFASLLILLLMRPQFIFEVGFQLSYLAVFAIVLIQPLLYDLYQPKNKLVKYFWNLTTVTLAAQLGVLPLSLYYFHQFPGLFFLSNLVILPFLGIILGIGILVIVLASLRILPDFLVEIYDFMIGSLNSFVNFIAHQQEFLFEEIPFSALQALAFYILLFSLIYLFRKFNYKNLIFGLSAFIILQLV